MRTKRLISTALLTLAVVLTFVLSWEAFWRVRGYKISYNDDKALWAEKRTQVYKPMDEATVFIGSSRIKFDLDQPTWKALTGEDAVQLSLVGTSPISLLQDLADDEKFQGKLVVDITEFLFFAQIPPVHKSAKEAVDFYHKGSPSEWFSATVNRSLERSLVFLEERQFSMNKLLESVNLPNRPGVFAMPPFPKTFEWNTRDRQTYMPDIFLHDTNAVKQVTNIWNVLMINSPVPPTTGEPLNQIIAQVKNCVEKIRNRGGKVIFVRTPSSGPMAVAEEKGYPKEKYWKVLLSSTNSDGIHYKDYPETDSFVCPEWSHLAPIDAVKYTHALANQLFHKGWFNGYPMQLKNL